MSERADLGSLVPGERILHPIVLLSALVLYLNDHVLKLAYGNIITGKLSDASGMILFPVFLASLVEVTAWVGRRPIADGSRVLMGLCCGFTLVLFSLINLSAAASDLYVWGLRVIWAALGQPEVASSMNNTVDGSDLIVLPLLVVAYRVGTRARFWKEPAGAERWDGASQNQQALFSRVADNHGDPIAPR